MTDKKKQGGPAYAPLPPRYYIFGDYDVWDKAQMLKYADDTHELRVRSLQANPTEWPLPHRNALDAAPAAKFKVGDLVTKTKGSQWKGRVVGAYSTTLTPEGYAVESSTERGSVQIYPAAALELVEEAQAEQSAITPESGTPPAGQSAATKAAPEAFLKGVIALCSHRGYSPANIEAWDKGDKWIADLWRQAEAMLAESPTPQPTPAPLSDREEIAMVDAAMVEMANIVPPLKRSECARLIRAALVAQGGKV